MKILICGGRNFIDIDRGFKELDNFHREHGVTHVIHGAARGADSVGSAWANNRNIPQTEYPANWNKYGRSAGYLRNTKMANAKPDAVLAFPGGRGTQHMIDIARKRGIPVYQSQLE